MIPHLLEREIVERLHRIQITKFGGEQGLRDEGALESALMRPHSKFDYGEADIVSLAAAYLFGLTKNCAFIEGNRRTALVATIVFLNLNGLDLTTSDPVIYVFMLSVAAGEIDEDGATRFLRDFTFPL